MQLRITAGPGAQPPGNSALRLLHRSETLIVEGSDDVRDLRLADGRRVLLLGDVVGGLGSIASHTLDDLKQLEGRFAATIVDERRDACLLLGDRFGQLDLYYQRTDGRTVVGTDLRLLPIAHSGGAFDQVALAHTFCVYGHRPAKKQTPYRDVHRLAVDEIASIAAGRFHLEARPFRPRHTGEYGEAQLHEYADLLLEAVRRRGSPNGNVVYLSSGWDSTALLACLVHLFGAGSVRAVIGRMTYANRSGVINQFELDRARAVADFFGIRLDVIEFDYCRRGPELVEELRPLFRGHHIATLTGLNHALLADHTAKTTAGDEPVFAGEISDGAHNLGFSQFVTIFHPVLAFREYSDKMASYLFGPTFLHRLSAGDYGDDVVFQLFQARAAGVTFDELAAPSLRTRQLLASFFLRANRLPLWSLQNVRVLTADGRDHYARSMEAGYLQAAGAEATPDTLYAWYLHLYNSFHWQGSTVSTLALTAKARGLCTAMPFWDGPLQDFLSAMPESWGRGLDLNPTKHPLKWMLAHRINYPMHLQVGPHSYVYDVDPSFSHGAEILYGSALAPYYRRLLARRAYRDVLSPEVFDLPYLDAAVQRYLDGAEVRGVEMNDLLSLCLVTATGWYGVEDAAA